MSKRGNKAFIIGVGLDSDGHKRITNGENFRLVGGKKETHERLQEIAIKTNEKLQKTGHTLEDIPPKVVQETLREVIETTK